MRVTSPHFKAVLRRAQLLGKHFDVALPEAHDRLIADDIHISCRRVEKHTDLGAAEILAASFNLRLGALDIIVGAEAVEDVLLEHDLRAARIGRTVCRGGTGQGAQRDRGAGVALLPAGTAGAHRGSDALGPEVANFVRVFS